MIGELVIIGTIAAFTLGLMLATFGFRTWWRRKRVEFQEREVGRLKDEIEREKSHVTKLNEITQEHLSPRPRFMPAMPVEVLVRTLRDRLSEEIKKKPKADPLLLLEDIVDHLGGIVDSLADHPVEFRVVGCETDQPIKTLEIRVHEDKPSKVWIISLWRSTRKPAKVSIVDKDQGIINFDFDLRKPGKLRPPGPGTPFKR